MKNSHDIFSLQAKKVVSGTDAISWAERERIRHKLVTDVISSARELVDNALGDGPITYEMVLPVKVIFKAVIPVAEFLNKKVGD